MIRISDLGFAFAGNPVFSHLELRIEQGEILSIIGPNGCGKSTLLRLLRGHLRPQAGEIRWDDIPLERLSSRQLARRVAVVPQATHIDFSFSVRQMVAMGRYPHRKNLLSFVSAADERAIRHALALTDVVDLAERPVTRLSGGELQRVLLARALAQDTGVLLLDEASSHLDIDHRLELAELLARLNREQHKTIIQVSHDLDLAAAISHRILMLSAHGEIVALGSPASVMTAANLHQLFRVDLRVDTNPYTGTPQVTALVNSAMHQLGHLNIHLVCGGGSGRMALRRLHLAGATLSAGPLNLGDSDHSNATALGVPVVEELPFHPYSATALEQARALMLRADATVILTSWWGEGNLPCLALAMTALSAGKRVYLVDPREKDDYTGGKGWQEIGALLRHGAVSVRNEDHLLEELQQLV
ncbi:MAG: ABC transporter ATP-binding protein [Pelovirga sp.]